MLGSGVTSYGTLPADVYSGTAGIGLFLAALWRVTRIEEIPPDRNRRDPSGTSWGS